MSQGMSIENSGERRDVRSPEQVARDSFEAPSEIRRLDAQIAEIIQMSSEDQEGRIALLEKEIKELHDMANEASRGHGGLFGTETGVKLQDLRERFNVLKKQFYDSEYYKNLIAEGKGD